jgi:hypothetical protein
MNKEFIPYEQALALKGLGFDEPCFGYYNGQGNYIGEEGKMNSNCNKLGMHGTYCTAPLYQQAFRWFREKYDLEGVIQQAEDFKWYKWKISQYIEDGKKYVADWYEYKTYEEAELACLEVLIELTKNKQHGQNTN